MVLHTDQGHPHVHLVVKAQSEDSQRLYIRKATLRQWREDFAGILREMGVAANATPTALRGKSIDRKKDGIYRALKRGRSTFIRRKVERVAEELQHGRLAPEAGKATLLATRSRVVEDWSATATMLRAQGQDSLAQGVEAYVRRISTVATEKELVAKALLAQVAAQRVRVRSDEREHLVGERAR